MLGSLSGKRELFKEKELLYCNYPSYNGDCTYDIYVETPDEFVIVESGEGHDDSVITTENEFFRSLNQKENKKLYTTYICIFHIHELKINNNVVRNIF